MARQRALSQQIGFRERPAKQSIASHDLMGALRDHREGDLRGNARQFLRAGIAFRHRQQDGVGRRKPGIELAQFLHALLRLRPGEQHQQYVLLSPEVFEGAA